MIHISRTGEIKKKTRARIMICSSKLIRYLST